MSAVQSVERDTETALVEESSVVRTALSESRTERP